MNKILENDLRLVCLLVRPAMCGRWRALETKQEAYFDDVLLLRQAHLFQRFGLGVSTPIFWGWTIII